MCRDELLAKLKVIATLPREEQEQVGREAAMAIRSLLRPAVMEHKPREYGSHIPPY